MSIFRKCKLLAKYFLHAQVYVFTWNKLFVIRERKGTEVWFSHASMLRSIIEAFQIDLVLDVGANKGQFAHQVRKFYKGLLISFEPVLHAFTELKRSASHDKNWFVFNYALGNESKEQYINVYESDDLSSLLEKNQYFVEFFGENTAKSARELIHVRRFDDIAGEIPFSISTRKIFLKMDTQGYDLEVVKGASIIRENLMALQSEVSQRPLYQGMPHWLESISEYEKAGFKLAGLYPVDKDGLQYIESDCLMVKV
jgi:FkbM family methyltransferase